jgi:hypothetical protein
MTEVNQIVEKQNGESEFSAPTEVIENCVSIVENIYNAKADSVVTAEEIFAITGKPRGTMSPKISACIQYGLLVNNSGGKGYRITDFGVSVIRPEFTDPNFIKKKLLESFNTPQLYRRLIERYNSKNLPNRDGLTNILVTEFGLNANSTAPRASVTFLENCTYLGINEGGRLRFFMPTVAANLGSRGNDNPPPQPPPQGGDEVKDDETIILIPLKKGERKARLILPNGFDSKDLSRIAKFVEALKDDE